MANVKIEDPKDEKITNKDDSVTNKDGDNYLEKGEAPASRKKPDKEPVPKATTDSDKGKPGSPEDKDPEKEDEKERLRHIL